MVSTETTAVIALGAAFFAALLLTPVSAWIARRFGVIDRATERGLAAGGTPRLGGLAICAAVVATILFTLDLTTEVKGVLFGALAITLVGALDDRFNLPAVVKLVGQIVAATIAVRAGVVVDVVTLPLPFLDGINFGSLGAPLTVLGFVVIMNVVNLSDGIDGLAAGVCAISALALAVIAFDLNKDNAVILAALTAGAALGFLVHNFHPASSFMGDCGSNLLGFLLSTIAVLGSVKTNAVLALVFPLIVLAVPFMDTTFVVLKRLKYHRPIYSADKEHFHHRLDRIGFTQRRTVLYLYSWTAAMAGLAVALRFIPYSDDHGHFHTGWTIVMLSMCAIALLGSFYLVYVLEIVKFKRLAVRRIRQLNPDATEQNIASKVERELVTGEFESIQKTDS